MNHQETEQVREVVQRYIDGTYTADIPALRSCFHEQARMTGFLGDTMLIGTPEPFFEDMSSSPSMESQGHPYVGTIKSLNVQGRIANAVLYQTGFKGSGVIEDHFHLIKDGGVWSFISKTFTTLD